MSFNLRNAESSMVALKALAALLAYPDSALIDALPEIREILGAEHRIARSDRAQLDALALDLGCSDLMDAQEAYVALFDRGRATSLNLYEHLHGDSRDRGQAMVELIGVYEKAGLRLSTRELPDYLPVLLEYLSTRPFAEARAMLADCAHLVRGIGEALTKRRSRYAAVMGTLLVLAGESGLPAIEFERSARADEDEPARLDAEWVDQPVTFGLGCGDARNDRREAQPIRFMNKVA